MFFGHIVIFYLSCSLQQSPVEGRGRSRREGGFTLMEVLMVIAVSAILSVIAWAGLNSLLPAYRLKIAAGDLYANLQRAKQEAIRINGECAVYFDIPAGRYHLVSGGPDGICNGPPFGNPPVAKNDDVLLNHISLSNYGSGVSYGSGAAAVSVPGAHIPPAVRVSYGNNWVRFDARGMAREMGYAYLTNNTGMAFAVGTPSLAGSVVLKKWAGNGWE